MDTLNVRFVGFQLKRWFRACGREIQRAIEESDRLPYRQAVDYSDLLRQNISTGKFDAAYSPYNLRYFDWKYNIFGSSGGFWELRGELLGAISVFKFQDKERNI